MPFQYRNTQAYSGSAASNPDTYYTSSNAESFVGGFIWVTGSGDIYLKGSSVAIKHSDINAKEFYPFEVERITSGASAYAYILVKEG
tara:strand:+ start:205 stop:465 length:261 start_codon:yes stop_codon:yes gene_type:complete